MIISQLAVTDFQVFQGRHEFDLQPRKKYNVKRPVILFGGLNGAGKTSTLTAVRLALYGKQILGKSTSNKAYETYLAECIHRARESIVQANSSSVELDFTYAKLGELKHYKVARSWTVSGKKLTEKLKIEEDGVELSELSNDQCQGFLNELVPVGVSELFFFDGEKIAELAEDVNGRALGDAIKKLLGLDTLDTLSADLGIYLRNKAKDSEESASVESIKELENQLCASEIEADKELAHISQLKIEIEELSAKIRHSENKLSEQGGAWATSRENEIQKQAALTAEKNTTITQLQETLAGSFPLALANEFSDNLLAQLDLEIDASKRANTAELITKQLAKIKTKLAKTYDKSTSHDIAELVESEFRSLTSSPKSSVTIHDVSDGGYKSIIRTLENAADQRSLAQLLSDKLTTIEGELEKAGRNIARAPLQSQIKPVVDEINSLQKKLGDLQAAKSQHIEIYKRLLREQIDSVRKLDKLSQKSFEAIGAERAVNYATGSREVLKHFSQEMARRKISDLENEFVKSFHQLARKDDVQMAAKIDPESFSVTLFDDSGKPVDKNRLSAGEKQIYAISILESLARTSGRKLPIIIDTPLGRLDSNHRANLVNNYFPRASHQVIILSTDTEVDEDFYTELSPHISHAYKLNYDPQTGSTHPTEEYFWKPLLQESA